MVKRSVIRARQCQDTAEAGHYQGNATGFHQSAGGYTTERSRDGGSRGGADSPCRRTQIQRADLRRKEPE